MTYKVGRTLISQANLYFNLCFYCFSFLETPVVFFPTMSTFSIILYIMDITTRRRAVIVAISIIGLIESLEKVFKGE